MYLCTIFAREIIRYTKKSTKPYIIIVYNKQRKLVCFHGPTRLDRLAGLIEGDDVSTYT